MFEPVYIAKDEFQNCEIDTVVVISARVGIVKLEGCYHFAPAIKNAGGNYGYEEQHTEYISSATCRRRYGAVPKEGEAYLVEEGRKYINWTRVDEDMYLLDDQGNIVKED